MIPGDYIRNMGFVEKTFIFYYHPQRRFRQGNVFTPVCESFCSQGGCLPHTHPHPEQTPPWADTPGQTPLGRQTPPGQTHPWADTTPLCSACWDMVNKLAVGILLECILVSESYHCAQLVTRYRHNSLVSSPDYEDHKSSVFGRINLLPSLKLFLHSTHESF